MAAQIINYTLPPALYRYRSLGHQANPRNKHLARELDAVREGFVWCSEYHDLNDAMEGLYSAGEQVRQLRGWQVARNTIRSHKSNLGIACFSELPDNALLWAHYSDSFAGICVEYNFETLRQGLPDDAAFTKMSYADRLFELGTELDNPTQLARWILSTKNHSWAYEREWRLFSHGLGRASYHTSPIRRILIGPRMQEPMHRHLVDALPGIEIARIEIDGYRIKPPAAKRPNAL